MNKGILFTLDDKRHNIQQEFFYKNGIMDYIQELNKNDAIIDSIYFTDKGKGKDRDDQKSYTVKVEICLAFNNNFQNIEYFHNSSPE